MIRVMPGSSLRDWITCTDAPLPVADALTWCVLPSCGAVVSFVGTVRDHAEGRDDVVAVEYEAYEEQVEPRLATVAAAARTRWPDIGRLVLVHRVGRLLVGDASVLVVASTPHRAEAFEAARFCIDTIKQAVPVWKRETWADGVGWGLGARQIIGADDIHHDPAGTHPPDGARTTAAGTGPGTAG